MLLSTQQQQILVILRKGHNKPLTLSELRAHFQTRSRVRESVQKLRDRQLIAAKIKGKHVSYYLLTNGRDMADLLMERAQLEQTVVFYRQRISEKELQ